MPENVEASDFTLSKIEREIRRMKIVDIRLKKLKPSPWNPNRMEEAIVARLKSSLARYGMVEPLVVRPISDYYEILGGNQRFKLISEIGLDPVPCVIVDLDDTQAKILAQALNGLHGEDDLGLKAKILTEALQTISPKELISILPETADSLKSLSQINEIDMAEHLQAWNKAQKGKLRHLQVQLTSDQMAVVEKALNLILPEVKAGEASSPNLRGCGIYLICKSFLEWRDRQ
ncbi:MAG: ParB N-terminal domain-containing protein [Dehalococcoidales bacterium]|nr:ParB N-terminal domain-containing protein [Dehalococcoidales bacterium]